MSKMYFEVKKYILERHMVDVMEYFKEKKVSFNFNNFNNFKPSKTLKLKIYQNENLYGGVNESKNIEIQIKNTNYQAKIYEYCDGYSKSISFVKINSIFNDDKNDFNENNVCGVMLIDENNNADINSIVNYQDCIKCFDSRVFSPHSGFAGE